MCVTSKQQLAAIFDVRLCASICEQAGAVEGREVRRRRLSKMDEKRGRDKYDVRVRIERRYAQLWRKIITNHQQQQTKELLLYYLISQTAYFRRKKTLIYFKITLLF